MIRRDVDSLDEKMGDELVSDEQHLEMVPTASRGAGVFDEYRRCALHGDECERTQ